MTGPTAGVDLLIVGSGPAGSAYARRVFELAPELSVLMIDAGPVIAEPPGIHVRNIEDPAARSAAQRLAEGPELEGDAAAIRDRANAAVAAFDRVLVRPGIFYADPESATTLKRGTLTLAAMASNVGGMGSHWSFACPHPSGAERIDWIDSGRWERALADGRRFLRVGTDAFPDTLQSEAILTALGREYDDELPADRRVQRMPLACHVESDGTRYWTGPDVVLGPAGHSARFQLRSSTLCRKLLLDGNRVVGVEVEDLSTGEASSIGARAVVVAGDPLRTPQLLWASGIRPAALGRHLNDHIQLITAARINPELLAAATATRPGLPNARRTDDDMTIGVFWVPYSEAHPFHGQVMHLDLAPVEIAPAQAAQDQIVGLGWFLPKEIRADDRVTFSATESDVYGMPAISTQYELTPLDLQNVEFARADVLRAAAAIGEVLPEAREPKLLPPGSSLHYQGTVRMGTDPATSVCDGSSRVWDFVNLFVGGAGVIPTSTAGNPTLTFVSLATIASEAVVGCCR